MLLSLLIVLAMGFGLVLFVSGVFSVFPIVSRAVTRSFWCRFRKRNVSAEFQEDPWSGRPVDVTRCTVFEPSSAVTCDKACLRLPKLDQARDVEAEAERVAERMLVQPPESTANADRVAEELLIEFWRS